MNMMKALVPATILTLILSALIGPRVPEISYLNMLHTDLGGYKVYWSWTFFFIAMAINGLMLMSQREPKRPNQSTPANAN